MRSAPAVVATVLVAGGCGSSPEPEPGPPDCRPCAAETAALRDVVADIDSVSRVMTIVSVTPRGNDPETTTVFYDGREVDAHEAAWGPRPTR